MAFLLAAAGSGGAAAGGTAAAGTAAATGGEAAALGGEAAAANTAMGVAPSLGAADAGTAAGGLSSIVPSSTTGVMDGGSPSASGGLSSMFNSMDQLQSRLPQGLQNLIKMSNQSQSVNQKRQQMEADTQRILAAMKPAK